MRHDAAFLEDMIVAADRIAECTRGLDLESFLSNRLVQEALAFNFTILGEAASRLPADLRERHPAVAWAKAKGMRNVVVHEYFGITWTEVWKTATVDVPILRAQLAGVFKAEFPDDTLEL